MWLWARPHDLKSRDIDLKPLGIASGYPGEEISRFFSYQAREVLKNAKKRKKPAFLGPFFD